MSAFTWKDSTAPLRKVKAIQFGILNPAEITKLSVAEIITDQKVAGPSPHKGGVHDKRMGPIEQRRDSCETCNQNLVDCPGHFGHIALAKPVYHHGFISTILAVLRCVCFYCHDLLTSTKNFDYVQALTIKDPADRLRAIQEICKKQRECKFNDKTINWGLDEHAEKSASTDDTGRSWCAESLPLIKNVSAFKDDGVSHKHFFVAEFSAKKSLDSASSKKQELSSSDVHERLKNISDENCRALGLDPKFARPDWMMITVLPVPPLTVRPVIMAGGPMVSEDDLTASLITIIRANIKLKEKEHGPESVFQDLVAVLQYQVTVYLNNNIPGLPTSTLKSGRPLKSISQRLKGKEGRIRGNLMGKRVDFSARTVITPDPNISIDQVGVPRSIALNLTFPEIVTPYNMARMQELVANGPNEHPGAKSVIRTDGERTDLRYVKKREELHLQHGYRVERHIQDGDIIVFNRQPSLHKMSMMGHRIKIMPFSTFRLNLSVTSPYNADFDGDEMNMHIPQTLNAKAEVMQLMMVPKQIISPQSNKPVIGIVQDSLLGSYLISRRDVFIEKDVVMNMLMWVNFNGRIPEPAILKPQQLWTGKQLFSIIIPEDINLSLYNNSFAKGGDAGEAKIDCFTHPQDFYIVIDQGKLLCGTLDKKILGASSGGLIHTIWMEHGPKASQIFIDQCQGLVNYWLLQRGYTIGIGDTVADEATRKQIELTIKEAKKSVAGYTDSVKNNDMDRQPGMTIMQTFESLVNRSLNKARDDAGSSAQKSLKFANNIKTMVTGGSKGSAINISQMMACVGQQNVEGRRIGYGFLDRTLPHFPKNDYGPVSRGFVENSYLMGLTPAEFFFHAMGGREGLIDTAVKTAETGYIQRRLVKAMEDVMVKYDGTVRNSLGDVIQFLYGEDGMDATFIEKQKFNSLFLTNTALADKYRFDVDSNDFRNDVPSQACYEIQESETDRAILETEFKNISRDREMLRSKILPTMDDVWPVPVNLDRLITNAKKLHNIESCHTMESRDLDPRYVIQQVESLTNNDLLLIKGNDKISKKAQRNATLLFNILLRSKLSSKLIIKEHKMNKESFDWLLDVIRSRFQQAKVHPGEMVGAVAAQSIGEPATQMTLNTFHYAGVSSKSNTVGVPRLKEIINVSHNIATPSMTVYLVPDVERDKEAASAVQCKLEYATLRRVCTKTEIWFDPDVQNTVTPDQDLLDTHYVIDDDIPTNVSSWVLRLELKFALLTTWNMRPKEICEQIAVNFFARDQLHCEYSAGAAHNPVIRIRPINASDSAEPGNDLLYLRDIESTLLDKLELQGINKIKKVFMNNEREKTSFDSVTGTRKSEKIWTLETEGSNLQEVLAFDTVDSALTITNDVVEVLSILGIEAARNSLLHEIKSVISFDGSYVNYRHLATLSDVMTYRGHLMSITRHGINRTQTGALMRCSFEETVDILIKAAAFAENDNLAGVSENIMLGQLAPLGTGSFELLLDEDMLNTNAFAVAEPASYGSYNYDDSGYNTPGYANSKTPDYLTYSPTSDYSSSPTFQNTPTFADSPYMSPSTYDEVSNYSSSPTYSPTSPSYSPTSPSYSPTSPSYSPTSPSYSPTSPSYSPTSPSYSPTSPSYSPTSPSYSPTSPSYSPTSPSYSPTSPSYSPTSPSYSPTSPSYSPTSPSYSPTSPSYSPTSPSYSPTSPSYSPTSPSYSPTSPSYSPTSPSYSPTSPSYLPTSPSYSPTSPSYSPTSPSYSPTSPSYSPTSPSYSPASPKSYSPASPFFGSASPAYSPSSPSYSQSVDLPSYSPTTPGFSGEVPQSPYFQPEEEEQKKKTEENK